MECTPAWAGAVRPLAGSAGTTPADPQGCPCQNVRVLPHAFTRDVPVLVLTRVSSMYEDGSLYLGLGFRPGPGAQRDQPLPLVNSRIPATTQTRPKIIKTTKCGHCERPDQRTCGPPNIDRRRPAWTPQACPNMDTVVALRRCTGTKKAISIDGKWPVACVGDTGIEPVTSSV
jgi:hypothetical protein